MLTNDKKQTAQDKPLLLEWFPVLPWYTAWAGGYGADPCATVGGYAVTPEA